MKRAIKKPSRKIAKATKGKNPAKFAMMGRGKIGAGKC